MSPSALHSESSSRGKRLLLFSIITLVVSFVVYYLTAFRTITWWNNSEQALAAVTLGISFPPGCLLGVLVGWVITRLAVAGSYSFALNLLMGVVAALTAIVTLVIAARTLRRAESSSGALNNRSSLAAAAFGATTGALTLAFSETFWRYAIQFTPYMFTAAMTALILWAMIKWWQHARDEAAASWLFVVTLLFGLDVSVHRTNMLLVPALIIWMLIRKPQTFLSIKTWIFGAVGLIVGLALQLVQIPMAAAGPFINAGNPNSLIRLWNLVSLQQLGNSWLTIFPRNAPFWDVQVADYLRAFSANFFNLNGPIPGLGLLPGLLGLIGLIVMWQKSTRLAFGLFILFLFASIGAVLYFNIPEHFWRSMFRHYLPSFVIFAVFIAYGMGSIMKGLRSFATLPGRLIMIIIGVILLAIPVQQLARNYHQLDGSNQHFAYDFAYNALSGLDDNAILITFGDNDTFPLWYLQGAEGIRTDVAVLNINLLNTTWYLHQIMRRYRDLPISFTAGEIDSLRPIQWQDSTIAVQVDADPIQFDLPDTAAWPDTAYLTITPTIQDKYLLAQDQVLMNLIQNNRYRRPIYFASTGRALAGVTDHLRFEGMSYRLMPDTNQPISVDILRRNLFNRYAFNGYADSSVVVDDVARNNAMIFFGAFAQLATAYAQAGDTSMAAETVDSMLSILPPDRIGPLPPHLEAALEQLTRLSSE